MNAKAVQERERHVAGANLQRDEVISERPDQQRDDHEEDHDRPMHGEEHGVELGRDRAAGGGEHPRESRHRPPRPSELVADGHGHQAPEHQEQQAREQELQADDLVVDREDVLPHEPEFVVVVVLAHRARLALAGLKMGRVVRDDRRRG
jgi:hypothetical protein